MGIEYGFKCVGMLTGKDVPEPVEMTLAASQTITKGDALIATNIGTTNTVEIALSNSPLIHAVAAESITTTGSTDTILAYPADPMYLFEARCSGTFSKASHIWAQADVEGTTGAMMVNENANTESVLQILEMVESDDNAEGANSRVIVRFIRSSFTPLLAAL